MKALITGARGQDGTIASQLLTQSGDTVYRLSHETTDRRKSSDRHYFWDWKSATALSTIIKEIKPDFILNLASFHQSSQGNVHDIRNHKRTFDINLTALEMMIHSTLEHSPKTKIVHASSSQIYAPSIGGTFADENTPADPQTIYGVSKNCGMQILDFYRKHHSLKASSGILFNHESIYRRNDFVTRMISSGVANIALGRSERLSIRNIGAKADFSSAWDVVRAIIQMAKSSTGQDYIVSSAQPTSIKELLTIAFSSVDLNWKEYTDYQEDISTPFVYGDNKRLKSHLSWTPHESIKHVMEQMVMNDIALLHDADHGQGNEHRSTR